MRGWLTGVVLLVALAAIVAVSAQQSPPPLQPPQAPVGPTPMPAALRDYTPVAVAQLRSPKDGDWLMNRRTYDGWGYSPLDQINPGNVTRLRPVWVVATGAINGHEAAPVVHDGVLFAATPGNQVMAIDVRTGTVLWRFRRPLAPSVIARHPTSRGVALLGDKVYFAANDAVLVAIDARTGREVWSRTVAVNRDGHYMSLAPLVADGKIVVGTSGGEQGIRGFLAAYDPDSGKELWRTYTVPAPGEPGSETWPKGDQWKTGGASVWVTGNYDPETNIAYWGTGNGGPWNPAWRGGDSLYICSILAIRPSTGQIVWHYQPSPGDPFDYDSTNELVLGELPIGGATRKVLMQANRNGFFYVLDRTDGRLLSATQFAKKVTWASGIDMKTGRPIDTDTTKMVRANVQTPEVEVWPSAFGGKNWMPMSFDPVKRRAYMNTINLGMKVKYATPAYQQGAWYLGLDLGGFVGPEDGNRGALVAWDPVSGKKLWEAPTAAPYWSGVLSTAGGLVFTGAQTGEFMAFDADTGKKLWQFQTGSGISGLPITWEREGKQYITVTSGAATVYGALAGDPKLAQVPAGGSVWTFSLMD